MFQIVPFPAKLGLVPFELVPGMGWGLNCYVNLTLRGVFPCCVPRPLPCPS
jgi:hypothetical protein